MTAAGSATGPAATFRFGVVVDGHVLPASVADVFASGKQNDVPTLTGANKHEGGATPHPEITAEAFQKQARQRFGELADEFLSLYPSATEEQARLVQNESSWDQARVSMYLWAMNRARTAKTKAFTYFWDHPLPGQEVGKYGAFHTSEVPYVMNALAMSERPFTDQDRRIADVLSSVLGELHQDRRSERPGTAALASGRKGAGRHHGNRRQERTHSGCGDAEPARVLREVLRAPAACRYAVS